MHQFKHRLPFGQVKFIECDGEATLNGFHYAEACSVDALPHERKFTECLQYNQHVIIYGVGTGDSWTVELTGAAGEALFQFVAKYKEKAVTRNACIGGNWGQEEKGGQFPFQRDRGFDLCIANLPSGLQVLCNNARFTLFNHRTGTPASDYKGLKITGDARIIMVRVAP
ncbi:galactoside-binding lectin [Cooperia oncophora]